ncbi:MAG TPA: hypothetical protein VF286_13120 [Acidiphilium sp.]
MIRLIETLCAILGGWSGTGASNARQLARSVQTLRDLAEQVRAIHADRAAAATADRPEARSRIPARIIPPRPRAKSSLRGRATAEAVHRISGNPATRTVHHVARAPP